MMKDVIVHRQQMIPELWWSMFQHLRCETHIIPTLTHFQPNHRTMQRRQILERFSQVQVSIPTPDIVCVSRRCSPDIADASFHTYSERVCSLHFSMGRVKYRVFACYLPTTRIRKWKVCMVCLGC